MDFDNDSPFARHFQDDSFTVHADADRSREVTLWMSFSPIFKTVDLAVYDPRVREYTHKFSGTSAADVDAFITGVEKDFGVKVPKNFRILPKEFLPLVDQAFAVHADLEEATYCDGCYDTNGSTITAIYFPPITAGESASLSLHWNIGCYGGRGHYGTVETTKDDILETLTSALSTADTNGEYDAAIQEVQEFKSKVEAL